MIISVETVELLQYLQYNMNIVEDPFIKASEDLDIDLKRLLADVNRLIKRGVIKRIGFAFNYRSAGMVSALVGMALDNHLVRDYARFMSSVAGVKHNFVRDHEVYNIWFTIRGVDDQDILNKVGDIASRFNVNSYIILKSLWTCKLSVKYNLEEGISWSPPKLLSRNPPNIREFGLDRRVMKQLRSIPVRERPFREIAASWGFGEPEFIDILREMMEKGVAVDFGAWLDGASIGFKHNAMVVFKGDESTCKLVVDKVPEATHVVLRRTIYGEWPWNIYFMIHGVKRPEVDERIHSIMNMLDVDSYMRLYSLRDLGRSHK